MKMKITALIIAVLFLAVPMTAISAPVSKTANKIASEAISVTTPPITIIPRSQFVINLAENEEVAWTADYVTDNHSVAYFTVETESEDIMPQGFLFGFYLRGIRITAYSGGGKALYWFRNAGLFRFVWGTLQTLWKLCSHSWYGYGSGLIWESADISTSGLYTDTGRIDATSTWMWNSPPWDTEGIISWIECDNSGQMDYDWSFF